MNIFSYRDSKNANILNILYSLVADDELFIILGHLFIFNSKSYEPTTNGCLNRFVLIKSTHQRQQTTTEKKKAAEVTFRKLGTGSTFFFVFYW